MIEEFHHLEQKAQALAMLTAQLRAENQNLRTELIHNHAQISDMQQRLQQAHERLSRLLTALPQTAVHPLDQPEDENGAPHENH